MKTNYIPVLVCENGCGSPSYGIAISKYIFESDRFEERVICGGCNHIQSREYSKDLVEGKVEPPLGLPGGEWIYPFESGYREALHYSKHEKLIEIVGLPRKDTKVTKRYS